MNGFAAVPDARRFVIANATLPAVLVESDAPDTAADGLMTTDITIADGKIERIGSARGAAGVPRLDLDFGMVWPCFVDMHTHIDKGHIWPRKPNPDGTFMGALEAVKADREANWSANDVAPAHGFQPAHRLCPRHVAAPHPPRLAAAAARHLLAGLRRDARTLGRPDRASGRRTLRHRRNSR